MICHSLSLGFLVGLGCALFARWGSGSRLGWGRFEVGFDSGKVTAESADAEVPERDGGGEEMN